MDHSEPKRPPPICFGFLEKQTHNTIKRWLVRYFELHHDVLRYYDAPHSRKLKGEIQLNEIQRLGRFIDGGTFVMVLSLQGKAIKLRCRSEQDAARWQDSLSRVVSPLLGTKAQRVEQWRSKAAEMISASQSRMKGKLLEKLQSDLVANNQRVAPPPPPPRRIPSPPAKPTPASVVPLKMRVQMPASVSGRKSATPGGSIAPAKCTQRRGSTELAARACATRRRSSGSSSLAASISTALETSAASSASASPKRGTSAAGGGSSSM